MTGSVISHTWIVAAVYLAAGVIGAVALRGCSPACTARPGRPAGGAGTSWSRSLRLLLPRCLGVGCVWAAVPSLPLHSGHRYDLDHAPLAAVVVVSMGSAKVAGVAITPLLTPWTLAARRSPSPCRTR